MPTEKDSFEFRRVLSHLMPNSLSWLIDWPLSLLTDASMLWTLLSIDKVRYAMPLYAVCFATSFFFFYAINCLGS